jgi:polar amino acid transport system substrate-binding protein
MKKSIAIIFTALIMIMLVCAACTPAAPAKKLMVAIDASYPPFEQLNEKTGKPEGYSVDLMNAVAAKAGLDIEWVNTSFQKLLAGVASCQYDLACSSISITEDRKKVMLFSDPVSNSGQVVVVRSDNSDIKSKDDLKGKIVGAQTASSSIIAVQKIAGAELKTYNEISIVFLNLMDGKCDAVVADVEVAEYYIARNSGKMKMAGTVFTDERDGIAICKKNEYLIPKINAALKVLKEDGTVDKLKNKWVGGK